MPKYIDLDKVKITGEMFLDDDDEALIPLSDVRRALLMAPVEDVAPVDELIEAAKKIICENTYPSSDLNGKPVNVWKAREGYDALDALKVKYKEV